MYKNAYKETNVKERKEALLNINKIYNELHSKEEERDDSDR